MPEILLSGFADETTHSKKLEQQLSVFAALGLSWFTIRFLDVGSGVKNSLNLTDSELDEVKRLLSEFGMQVSSMGSPIGKVKLVDVDDGTSNLFRPFEDYLENEIRRACRVAQYLETKLIRGFSFYHPKGADVEVWLPQAIDQIGEIARVCQSEGLVFGLEVEANLVGQNGFLLAEMHRQIRSDALVTIFDGGNLVMQGYSTDEIYKQYLAMKDGLGWIHIKDFGATSNSAGTNPNLGNAADAPRPEQADVHSLISPTRYVDEERVSDFVPADCGGTGHLAILRDLAGFLPTLEARMKRLGVPGVFADLEPHLRGGGQFGGFSGPDGFGVALRAFCGLCGQAGISYRLRSFEDIQIVRGD